MFGLAHLGFSWLVTQLDHEIGAIVTQPPTLGGRHAGTARRYFAVEYQQTVATIVRVAWNTTMTNYHQPTLDSHRLVLSRTFLQNLHTHTRFRLLQRGRAGL